MVFAAVLELYGISRRHRVVAFIFLVQWFVNPTENSDWLIHNVSRHTVIIVYTFLNKILSLPNIFV